MAERQDELDALRREVDELDDRIHDLLIQRTSAVERIGTVKAKTFASAQLRPGREAAILRRLLARHNGRLPRAVIARIWRELIAALSRLQDPFRIAVCAPEKSVGYWDMVRRHYGSSTPMSLHRSMHTALRAVGEGERTLCVLPLPQEGEAEPWWPHLAIGAPAPRIIARLPFVPDDSGQFENVAGLVLAGQDPEPSGEDVALLVVALQEQISRARLSELLRQAGLPGQSIAVHGDLQSGPEELHLVEIGEFVGSGDPRLARLPDLAREIQRVSAIGAYAVPLGAA